MRDTSFSSNNFYFTKEWGHDIQILSSKFLKIYHSDRLLKLTEHYWVWWLLFHVKRQRVFQPETWKSSRVLCSMIAGETHTKVCSPRLTSWWQITVKMPPKFNLANKWVLLGLINGSRNDSKTGTSPKAHPGNGCWLTKAGNLHHTAWGSSQVGGCPGSAGLSLS